MLMCVLQNDMSTIYNTTNDATDDFFAMRYTA